MFYPKATREERSVAALSASPAGMRVALKGDNKERLADGFTEWF